MSTEETIVIKRDGSKCKYDFNRIVDAVTKAKNDYNDGGIRYIDELKLTEILHNIDNKIKHFNEVDIETIQKYVETDLMSTNIPSLNGIARSYIEYRTKRDNIRESKSALTHDIEGLLKQSNLSLIHENANKDSKIIPTQRDLLAGITAKNYSKKFILPKDVVKAHEKGEIHYHDLDYAPFFPMFNCFDKDTKFVSEHGLKAFKDFRNGDRLNVPTAKGRWRTAKVVNYGKQKLNKIYLKCLNTTSEILATSDHRWLLHDGSITTSLSVGDKLLRTPILDSVINSIDQLTTQELKLSWIKGFIFGDGTKYENGSRLLLCGKKTQYEHIFSESGFNVTTPKSNKPGYKSVVLPGIDKKLIDISENESNISAWVYGFLCADGTRTNSKNKEFSCIQISTNNEISDFIDIFSKGGYNVTSVKDKTNEETNFGKRTKPTFMVYLNYNMCKFYWSIINIEYDYVEDDVWCLEVEDDNSFILEKGITTGNCMLIDIKGMLENGFKMGNAEIETPKSISTACAITAQIIAQVASHIYGGNTINRIDEVLAPYVKVSYDKYVKEAEEIWSNLNEKS